MQNLSRRDSKRKAPVRIQREYGHFKNQVKGRTVADLHVI